MALTNLQYDELMRQYDRRQLENMREGARRREEVFGKIPRLAEIEEEIASCSVEGARLVLDGDEAAQGALSEKLGRLREEKSRLLIEHGFSADCLDPVYTCPDCRDTGYVDGQKCHCFRQAEIDIVYEQSNIKDALERENFSTFSLSYYSDDDINPTTKLSALETAKNAKKQCLDFVENFDEKPKNLLFYGDTGVGKTFMCNCIAKELLDSGRSVVYFTAFQFFDILSKGVFDHDADAIAANETIFDCDLLVIDDLGTEMQSAFTASQLFLCVNERILRHKSTVISTNLNLAQLTERYSERTFSRIMDNYALIKLFTSDIRLQKRRASRVNE
ncbi:MAG: ATP-binding protein [Clostridiales bacterium]|nr:ATP-binding protein [Clostridiales bacterium]